MSHAVRGIRQRWWLIPLVAVLAIGTYLILPSTRGNTAPTNDSCSNIASQGTLHPGDVVNGDTTSAVNDYNATITPTTTPVKRAVPAAANDVVYRVAVTEGETPKVTVKAPYEVSLYAMVENIGETPIPNSCG